MKLQDEEGWALKVFGTGIGQGIVVVIIMSVLLKHAVHPPAYRECKAEAAKTDSNFYYTTLRGCVIFNHSSERIV